MKAKSLLTLMAAMWFLQAAAELPRRGYLGAHLEEVCDSTAAAHNLEPGQGIFIPFVVENSSAEAIGLKAGDIVLKANGNKTDVIPEFTKYIQNAGEGAKITLKVSRNGQTMNLKGELIGFPAETSPYARVIYDQVPFEDGYVRTIIHAPEEPGKYPALFFVQGYTCVSMDNMGDSNPVRKLLEGISKRGFVVVKTEKAGIGDSQSSRDCSHVNLFEEVEMFAASFNALKKYDFIDHDNVFVFGHSMGGVQAPLMQTDFDPKGIIVYGTVVRPWFEYLIEQTRMQRLIIGQDFLVNEANHEQSIRFYYRFLIEKETPEQLMQDPEMADFLDRYWRYEEGGLMNGRHYSFWHQLQDTELFTAWSQTNAHVLSVHGQGEYIAFNPYEHELIADIVNHYNPGKATYVSMPNIDHAFIYVNDREHSAAVRNDGAYWTHNFNHSIVNLVSNWMKELVERD